MVRRLRRKVMKKIKKKIVNHIYSTNPKSQRNNKTPKLNNIKFKSIKYKRQKNKEIYNNNQQKRQNHMKADKIRTIYDKNKQGEWIEPFIGMVKRSPTVNVTVDEKKIEATVDTGATRIMATSKMALQLWGPNYKEGLQEYPNRVVEDAQGNECTIEGFRISNIRLGDLTTNYPIVIYQAGHEELLLGYTFLAEYELIVYCGKGIGTAPFLDTVKRLNFRQEPMKCSPLKDEEIPPRSMKTIRMKVEAPEHWSLEQKKTLIGQPVVVHSEDMECVELNQLRCPYTYDILELEFTVHALVDNSDNIEPLLLKKGEITAHAEIVDQAATQEQVKRLIKEGTYDFETETQRGEYKLEKEEVPERFAYIDQINIKTDDKKIEDFCKKLLKETEEFWSKHTFDLGKFDRKARITLNSTTPVCDRFRPIHPDKEKQAAEIIEQLERHNIISRANSPFNAQPVWVFKKAADKQGKEAIAGELNMEAPRKLRLAIDFRKVNKLISSQCHWPNPSIRETLFKLKHARYLSILDLTNSYWNIELDDATRRILAFQTATAQFCWNRLPQGIQPAMAIMAEAVTDTIMSAGIADCTTCYVDNIIISSKSLEQHKRDLHRTIEGFRKRGWKAVPSKSHLFIQDQCRLFGFHINLKNQTIGPDPQKVQAILELPAPHNQKSARSLCGTVNYYSELVPNLAPLMAPLHEITKDGKFEWTEECKNSFEKVKKELSKLPVVFMPDFQAPMHLFTDAAMSQYLAYHISQYRPKLGKYVPLAYGSHKFNQSEKSMSQPEAELYAIIYGLMNESLLLAFSKIIMHTDCKSLTYLFRFSKICTKLSRWQIILSSFDTEIVFEPSSSVGIQLSDLLSRRPGDKPINRRPRIEEIEELPEIQLQPGTQITMNKAREEIMKNLDKLPPIAPTTIKYLQEKYTPQGMEPATLACNKEIIMRITKDKEIEEFKQTYKPQYVYTPEHLAFKKDITPPGRLINLILEEAPHLSLDALRGHQLADHYFGPKMKQMIETDQPVEDYILKNGIMLRKSGIDPVDIEYQICVPRSLVPQLITKFHYNVFSGHPDLKKMMSNLKKRFYIRNLKQESQMVLKSCQLCSLNKSFNTMHQPFGNKIKITGCRQVWAMDICTIDYKVKEIDPNLPSSFLIITDAWSLYTLAIPIQANATAKEILEKFSMHIIQPYGLPKIGICTDGASNFSNTLSNTFSAVLGIQQYRISPYNARANPSERCNRALLAGLRMAIQQFELEPETFKSLLNYIVLAWNTSVLSHINFSPYQLFLSTNYDPAALTSFVTVQEAEKNYNDFIAGLIKSQTIIENLVNQRFQATRDKRYKENAKHSKHTEYSPGMQVMIKLNEDNTKRCHKLRPRFKGPFKITKEFQNNLEVIPWMPNQRTKFIEKYHNESKRIPKFEKYLISKDRVKPITNMTYYYDDNLARHFYQTFWDQIRDVKPITEVERFMQPQEEIKLENDNPNRPSSVVQPHQLGIPRKWNKIKKDQENIQPYLRKKPHPSESITTKRTTRPSSNQDNQNAIHGYPNNDNNRHHYDNQQSSSDDNDDNDDDDDKADNGDENYDNEDENGEDSDNYNDNTQEEPLAEIIAQPPQPQNTENQTRNMTKDKPHQSKTGAIPKQPQPQQNTTSRYTTKPFTRNNEPLHTKPTIKERWQVMPQALRFAGSNTAVVLQGKPSQSNQGHQGRKESTTNQPVQPSKSTKTNKSTKTRRTDPAIQEALSSKNNFFKDPAFQNLKDYHSDLSQDIENVSATLEENYRNIQENIEAILSGDEN